MSNAKLFDRIVIYITYLWKCNILHWHEWTCAAAEGVKATPEQLASGIDGFYSYARMYCKHCGAESEISRTHRERMSHE